MLFFDANTVYHQFFDGGDKLYFKAVRQQNNKRWAGFIVRHYAGCRPQKPKQYSADAAWPHWLITPADLIPASLRNA
jgi:hypothetical protein